MIMQKEKLYKKIVNSEAMRKYLSLLDVYFCCSFINIYAYIIYKVRNKHYSYKL